jgi:hypothetical protein
MAELTVEYLQQNGLKAPIIFHELEHLGLVVPRSTFTVADVMWVILSKRLTLGHMLGAPEFLMLWM